MTKEEIQNLIEQWKEFKAIEQQAKENRLKIESMFIENNERMEGKEVFDGTTEKLEISYKSTVVIDQDMAREFDSKYDRVPFRAKYDLDKKMYDVVKDINPQAYEEFSNAVTLKPAKPAVTIKEMK